MAGNGAVVGAGGEEVGRRPAGRIHPTYCLEGEFSEFRSEGVLGTSDVGGSGKLASEILHSRGRIDPREPV